MTEPGELDAGASVEDLERTLRSPSYAPTIGAARHVRNVAAEHLLADPSRSARLATALMDALGRGEAPEEAVAIGWRCRAEAELYAGRPLDARRSYERAVESAMRAGADRERGQILVGLLIVLNTLGERERAAAVATRAERILKRVQDRSYLGKLYLAQGNSFYEAERYDDAHREYRSAHRILKSEGTVGATWAILLMNLGVASMYLGRIDESRRYLLDSEAHATDHGLDLLRAHARFNRAFLERLRGDYRAALHLLESAREGFVRHDTGSLPASVDRAMAEIYIDLAMPGDALPLARRARETFDEHGMWLDARISGSDEAVVLLETGRPQSAWERLLELDRAFRSRRMTARRAVVRFHTARALLILGRAREARSTAGRARRTLRPPA